MRKAGFTLVELLVVIAIISILAAILFPVFAQAREKAQAAACLSNTRQMGIAISLYAEDFDERLPMGGNDGPSGANRWYDWILPYQKSQGVFLCPSAPGQAAGGTGGGGYGCDLNLMGWAGYPIHTGPPPGRALSEIADSAGTFVIAECSQCTQDVIGKDPNSWNSYVYRPRPACDWQVTPPGAWDNDNDAHYTRSDPWGDETRRPMPRHQNGLSVVYADGHSRWLRLTDFVGPMPKGWPYGDPHNSWDNR